VNQYCWTSHLSHNRQLQTAWPLIRKPGNVRQLKKSQELIDWVEVLHPTQHKIVGDVPQGSRLVGMEKLHLTRKHTFTNQKKCTTTQSKHKQLKQSLVASYDIWPGNRNGLSCFWLDSLAIFVLKRDVKLQLTNFWFWRFINLSLIYFDTYPLTYCLGTDTVPKNQENVGSVMEKILLWKTVDKTSCLMLH